MVMRDTSPLYRLSKSFVFISALVYSVTGDVQCTLHGDTSEVKKLCLFI